MYVYVYKILVRECLLLIFDVVNSELSSFYVLLLGISKKIGCIENGRVSCFFDNYSFWLLFFLFILFFIDRGFDWFGRILYFKMG